MKARRIVEELARTAEKKARNREDNAGRAAELGVMPGAPIPTHFSDLEFPASGLPIRRDINGRTIWTGSPAPTSICC